MTISAGEKPGPAIGAVGSVGPETPASDDDTVLARLGKKAVLKRNFGFFTVLGLSCTLLITWEGSLVLFITGLQNGGPSGIIYGFLVTWAGTMSAYVTLAELVSMAPTSGGQYHWVSMLSPPSSRKFLGYMTGWLTTAGWLALVTSAAYLTGTMVQGLISLTRPSYLSEMQNWHGTLLLWAIVLFCYGINTAFGSLLAKFEGVVLVLHICGFFAILFPLIFVGEHSDSETVFDNFLNLGGWQTQGLSFCIGLIGNAFAFLGSDGVIHLSEEIRGAAVVVPWSIVASLLINGTMGFAMVIATLYCMGDIDAALEENPQYPFMAIFNKAVKNTAGAAVMSALVLLLSISATTGAVASASRVLWAFARDRGLPGWSFLKTVSPRTKLPTYAVLTTVIVAIILSFISIGNPTAFNGVISMTISGLFMSYLIPSSLLLYRRLTGGIRVRNPDDILTNTTDASLTWGPWRLPGVWGIANNMFACVYLIFMLFFSFWPPFLEVTAQNMNWSVLVFVVVLVFSIFYYAVWARKVYSGPIIELDI